jgi:acetyl-CoA carboxylase biotin carboxyl carrier protein
MADATAKSERGATDLARSVMRAISGTDVEEVEVQRGDVYVRVLQDPSIPIALVPATQAEQEAAAGVPITAPLTGVYYARPSPEQPPFVQPGDAVSTGQVVALIETMKLFNEVVSEFDGTVLSLAAKDGDLIDKGAPILFVSLLDTIDRRVVD